MLDLWFESALDGLSVAEVLRDGGLGFGAGTESDRLLSGRAVELEGEVLIDELKETSLLAASLVLNILVKRFVMDGFSGAV